MDFRLIATFSNDSTDDYVSQDILNALMSFLPYMVDNVDVKIEEV